MDKEREALESMVFQFGYRGVKNNKPIIWTGGLSALEEAFEVLGWDDPHYLPEEGYTCEVVGCMNANTAGTHWGDSKLYLCLCSYHYRQSYSGVPMPPIKQWALDREATRDPVTRRLPISARPEIEGTPEQQMNEAEEMGIGKPEPEQKPKDE